MGILAEFFPCLFKVQALDTFNTAVVSPIYYVMFTSLTILASVIMFKVVLPFIGRYDNALNAHFFIAFKFADDVDV